ncbi:MAG: ATP-grasp domain-containing protein, partial [Anaerolineales bacterium]|nr:ATP-grasp domain-containing protein [Anaerolineales bacterium]
MLKEDQSLLDVVSEICLKYQIDLCMPVDMHGMYYFSKYWEQINQLSKLILIQPSEEIIKFGDKGKLADFLFKKQFPHPATITSQTAFEKQAQDFNFPILIKPRLLGNGDGIIRYANPEELSRRITEQIDFFEEYVIQEFIEGVDIDCSVLCKNGKILAYTIQKGLSTSTNLESYRPAEAIEFVYDLRVLKVASELMFALKWNGVAHIDLRVRSSDGKVFIIEINPRFWGSLEGSLHVGVNFPY